MNIAIWIVIALVIFVLPAVSLTSGGSRAPGRQELEKYAHTVGLPLTDTVAGPVVARIRRRQRGMMIGGIVAIVAAALAAMFIDGAETLGPLVVGIAGTGAGFGGAWALAAYRPEPTSDRPVIARVRSVTLADYLMPGERFALIATPAALALGALAGTALLWQLPAEVRGGRVLLGIAGSAFALLTWAAAIFAMRRVLAAPARSGSDLELAWDDAERAFGLRQVNDLVTTLICASFLVWLIAIGYSLTSTGFYRADITTAYVVTGLSLLIFGGLSLLVAFGPIRDSLGKARQGYEQRQLWPHGVSAR